MIEWDDDITGAPPAPTAPVTVDEAMVERAMNWARKQDDPPRDYAYTVGLLVAALATPAPPEPEKERTC